jgi:hypothetical protein
MAIPCEPVTGISFASASSALPWPLHGLVHVERLGVADLRSHGRAHPAADGTNPQVCCMTISTLPRP